MTINTAGYYVNNGKWKLGAEGQITGQGKQQHSEIGVYNALGKKASTGPYLIVQDAFPCAVCDAAFKKQALPVLVKVTANNGAYSADQGLGLSPAASIYPYYLWYYKGAKTAGTATAPAGFPAIPNFDAV